MNNSKRTKMIVLVCLSHACVAGAFFWIGMNQEHSRSSSTSRALLATTSIDVLLDPCGAAAGILHLHKQGKTPWTAERHLDIWKREFGSMLVDYALAVSHLKSTNVSAEEYRAASVRFAEVAVQNDLLALYPEPEPGKTSVELRINHPLNPAHRTNRQIIQEFIHLYSQPPNAPRYTPSGQPKMEFHFGPTKVHETKQKR